jgi:hypothetical protein
MEDIWCSVASPYLESTTRLQNRLERAPRRRNLAADQVTFTHSLRNSLKLGTEDFAVLGSVPTPPCHPLIGVGLSQPY